jgi:hypothetical protein
MMSELEIKDCEWEVLCPKRWDDLAKTEHPKVRFCNECNEHVFLCESAHDQLEHHRNQRCIALPIAPPEPEMFDPNDRTHYMRMGRESPMPLPPYKGPFMRVILQTTKVLSLDQLEFLAHVLGFQGEPYLLGEKLWDGKPHILQKNLTPDRAYRLMEDCTKNGISTQLEVEPEVSETI